MLKSANESKLWTYAAVKKDYATIMSILRVELRRSKAHINERKISPRWTTRWINDVIGAVSPHDKELTLPRNVYDDDDVESSDLGFLIITTIIMTPLCSFRDTRYELSESTDHFCLDNNMFSAVWTHKTLPKKVKEQFLHYYILFMFSMPITLMTIFHLFSDIN